MECLPADAACEPPLVVDQCVRLQVGGVGRLRGEVALRANAARADLEPVGRVQDVGVREHLGRGAYENRRRRERGRAQAELRLRIAARFVGYVLTAAGL